MLSRASGNLLRKLTRNPAASKDIFMDCCVRAPCVLRRRQSRGGCLSKGYIMLSRTTGSMEEVGA